MKNIRFEVRARKELQEALFGVFVAAFFVAGLVCMTWLWVLYGDQLSLTHAIQAAFTTVYAGFVSVLSIWFSGGYALERGKIARYYYRRMSECHAFAQGHR